MLSVSFGELPLWQDLVPGIRGASIVAFLPRQQASQLENWRRHYQSK